MKKLFTVLTLLLVMIFGIGAPQTAQAAIDERPVGFVVIDNSGDVTDADYKQWRTATRWAYRFPKYKIVDSGEPEAVVGNVLVKNVKVTPELLANLAEESKVDVLVIVKVYAMSDHIVSGNVGLFDDGGPYVLLDLSADMYVYKKMATSS